ncbi:molybdopterin-guanine dinucleotide biosynthesis protein B [uncultured Desulfuromusa sp.]|uniref:molybdopterin-guanine dinucleotide biosynthesis protein B n=1 Tax=uncultured Desulfuromusa sp. TaxID=219183 RepID=UPI002AA644E4|nr:molybdopterin-guanine dinucleotide biosynthesis protein B [uncultured Desulfuromusa sp.]
MSDHISSPDNPKSSNKPSRKQRLVSFAGYSGSGKTTLVEAVIKLLTKRGYKVGAIKHDGHRFDIDKPGKDSWRMTNAGASVTVITDDRKLAMIKQHDATPPPEKIISDYFSEMDIVIIEGWKRTSVNRIEVYRKEIGREALCLTSQDDGFVAIATDIHIETALPQLDINNPQVVVNFIVDQLV